MSTLLPSANPNALTPEVISPEGIQVAEAYFENGSDLDKAAQALGMPKSEVVKIYNRPEVRNYVTTVFNETGFRNRHRMGQLVDSLINLKLEQLDETGLGSDMDIMDMIKIAHKMKMEELKAEADLLKAKAASSAPRVASQTNIQINDPGYMKILEQLDVIK